MFLAIVIGGDIVYTREQLQSSNHCIQTSRYWIALTVDNDFGESLFIANAEVYCGFDEEEEDHSKIKALTDRNLAHDSIVSLEWKQF